MRTDQTGIKTNTSRMIDFEPFNAAFAIGIIPIKYKNSFIYSFVHLSICINLLTIAGRISISA